MKSSILKRSKRKKTKYKKFVENKRHSSSILGEMAGRKVSRKRNEKGTERIKKKSRD